MKAEYLALVFKSENGLELPAAGATAVTGTNTVVYSAGNLWVHVARIGLNYSFGGPVAAAY